MQQLIAELEKRGYEAKLVTREEALTFVAAEMKKVASVGWGGSESVKEIGLRELAAAEGLEIREHRTDAELFLLSANALLTDGRIVNIDGNGNRIAASIFGPKKVIYVIGRNKIVSGGLDDAIARIRAEACPPNAKRLGRKTPCGLTGKCCDPTGFGCRSEGRMCKVTAVFEMPPTHTPTTVLLVDEKLGF